MIAVFWQTFPFFLLIALGYGAGRSGFFSSQATAALTKFVFYFALSAMLFHFAARLSFSDVFNWTFVAAYLCGSVTVYLLATVVALIRKRGMQEAAVEAQCAVIGNVGFLGVPMLVLLIGEAAIGPVMQVLAIDLIVFSSLIVILISTGREGRLSLASFRVAALGLLKNPMIVSIALGLGWSIVGWELPEPAAYFLETLGAAATPGALFAIGASLADKSAERLEIAAWLSGCKLLLHPALVAIFALFVFPVDPFQAAVMVACAALPVAGNVYILAQHYGIAPHRASTAILISTVLSVITLPAILAWLNP
ncbi:AEC family transporter [Qingshengfaniella alkalisoli]|uniref:AEC family transporter n=1 Tax=Qingshengfaniella alkalisoli TaxID=2599296 RepID=A0A5B8J759_9RHOB|nr:AEC family transporter [Qingshengfaniella alkalisoli]QDY70307.1 AEC family transporter [Qingshengfaniella alkalisoli]